MALKDIFKNFVSLNEDDLEDEVEETTATEEPEAQPRVKREPVRRSSDRRNAPSANTAMKVVIVRPEVFDEVAGIADHLVQGKTVVLNLETANKDISRRIVDFMSGAAYALGCKLKKIANNTFIIVPSNTDIAGELMLDDFDEQNYYL
ncbi:MAG: cell division protein SepF [Acutalibacteraceae bacterium]|nr:cell division protein SepF [Acutalibacteraceae bacterium]